MNAIEEVFKLSKAMFLVALFATVPGYWFTVFLIDKMGRFIIQLGGFLLMSIFMAVLLDLNMKSLKVRRVRWIQTPTIVMVSPYGLLCSMG